MNLAVLQIRSTPISTELPSPATLFFNRPIRVLLPQMSRDPININNNNDQYEAPKAHQDKYVKDSDTYEDSLSFPVGSTVAVQHKCGGP